MEFQSTSTDVILTATERQKLFKRALSQYQPCLYSVLRVARNGNAAKGLTVGKWKQACISRSV